MMKRPFLGLVAVLMILAAAMASAEGRDSAPELTSPAVDYPNAAGAFGSSLLGGGLSYQHWFGPFGIAVTAGGLAYPYTTYYGIAEASAALAAGDFLIWNYNVQLEVMYRLYASNIWNWLSGDLYAYASLGHKGSQDAVYVDADGDYNTSDDAYYTPGTVVFAVAAGVGIGYEFVLFRHFSVPVQFGYVVEYPLYVSFNFSGGLRYRF